MNIIIAPQPKLVLEEIEHKLKTLHIDSIQLASTLTANTPPSHLIGNTLTQTAQLRALWWANETKQPVAAEAAGLQIKMLQNLPGVLSEIWSGTTSWEQNLKTLTGQLNLLETSKSPATYICVCALAYPGQNLEDVKTTEGHWSGRTRTSGTDSVKGVEYDSVFETYTDKTWKLAAEMNLIEKSLYSHRGKAWREIARACSQ